MSDFITRMKERKEQISARATESARFDDPNSSEYRPNKSVEATELNLKNTKEKSINLDNLPSSLEDMQKIVLNLAESLSVQSKDNTKSIQDLVGVITIPNSFQDAIINLPIDMSKFVQDKNAERKKIIEDMRRDGQTLTEKLAQELQQDPEAKGSPPFINNLKEEQNVRVANIKKTEETELPKIIPKLLNRSTISSLEGKLKERVFGQDEVVEEVVNVLKSAFVSLKVNKKKPAGSYFFAGPSGVGKTELARTLADSLEVPMLVINMGEYALEHEVSKLLGAPPGYLGFEEGGVIPNFIAKNPRGIILFDEVEKAHASADNILLSIMDQGVCQDNKGKDVNFKETIIISTSNIGAKVEYIPGLTQEEKNEFRMEAIKENLRPEIIGRYDSIFHFHSLKPQVYLKIVNKFLKGITESASEEHSLKLEFSDSILNLIAERSYDPALGGRPAGKFIEKVVVLPLADFMLRDDFEAQLEKHPTITLDLNEDNNVFFRGNNSEVLGILEDTAAVIQRIENNRFTNKEKKNNFKLDPSDEVLPISPIRLSSPIKEQEPVKAPRKMKPKTS